MDKILCINNKNKPNEVPQSKWDLLKEGELYTPIQYIKCNVQGGAIGVKLAEINIDDCAPYTCFGLHRFAIPVEIKEKVEELEEVLV